MVEAAGVLLVVLGVFTALVLWLGVDGGGLGRRIEHGLRVAVGRLTIAVPVVLVVAGAALLGTALRRIPRRLVAGCVLLGLAALLLTADAATTGPAARAGGGWLGGTLHGLVAGIAGQVGVVLLAVVIAAAALLLLTGWSVGTAAAGVEHAVRWLVGLMRRGAPAVRAVVGAGRRGAHALGDGIATLLPSRLATDHGADDDDEDGAAAAEQWDDEDEDAAGPGMPTVGAAAPFDGGTIFPELFVREPAVAAPVASTPPWEADEEPVVPEASAADDAPPAEETMGDVEPSADAFSVPVEPAGVDDYVLPDADVLLRSERVLQSEAGLERVGRELLGALGNFGVEARLVGTVSGPRVTRYELQLAPGTKVGKVTSLKDDLAYALATTEIRILAPIPGKQAVGVEVPNLTPNMVTLGDIHGPFPPGSSPLTVWLGQDIAGNNVHADLAKMPHLLVAGTTGSGKSGCLNAMLVSILLHATPEQARLILIDPKKVELNHYEAIPHLLTPVVTNMKGAAAVLLNIVGEMERRYEVMGTARARNLGELNRMRREKGRETLPHILVVIDELADLMMVSPAEVEDAIIRLAQKSRAVGIHLVLATQRPSVDVITGMIKANVPSRIAFAVSGMTDSRVILDTPGAESLLGQGDMLFRGPGTSRLQRVQGAYVTEEEIALVVEQCRRQAEPEFEAELLELPEIVATEDAKGDDGQLSADEDPMLDDAIRLVVNHETASVSLIQRRLRVGYTRAGRLIDMLERRGVISGYEGSKPRQVLITESDLPRLLGGGATTAAAAAEH